jgi:hypothetical protein
VVANHLVDMIVAAAREVADRDGRTLPRDLDEHVELFGRSGIFDSLGLVSLVVAVEEAVADRYGRALSLADERALSETRSPFRTIGTLAEYTQRLLEEAGV